VRFGFTERVIIQRQFVAELSRRLREPLNFIQVVVGPRQVGKTTGLRQLVKGWNGPAHMVTADEVAPPRADWIEVNWRIAQSMGPGALLVVDEIQKIPHWSTTVKRLFDEGRQARKLKVVLLGSASLALQQGLADSLAGRYELIRADHWDLAECEQAFNWDLNAFLKFGGYPGAAELTGDVPRWRAFIRDAVIEPVLLKDLLSLTAIAKPALFRQTFELALTYPAQEVSLQKLLGQLQEVGNVSTIKHYLEIFQGAFLLHGLQKYSGSEVRKRASSPKLVPMNTALVHAFHDPADCDLPGDWRGRVLEAAVGAALCRRERSVYYWRDGRDEVDYVVATGSRLYAVEVKSGRPRGTGGLAAFLTRFPRAIPVIVDRPKAERLLRGAPLQDIAGASAEDQL
jgi:predicted AAA+ superfamily ATPase